MATRSDTLTKVNLLATWLNSVDGVTAEVDSENPENNILISVSHEYQDPPDYKEVEGLPGRWIVIWNGQAGWTPYWVIDLQDPDDETLDAGTLTLTWSEFD